MPRVAPRVRALLALTLLATLPVAAGAQAAGSPLAIYRPDEGPFPFGATGPVNAAVPTPRQVLGYELGERFTTYDGVQRYLERLAAATPRVRLDTLGRTFEGRPIVLAIVTSEANQGRLPEIRSAARQLAHPRTAGDADALAARTPAIVWLGFSIHGNEASGTEASLALLYHLAAFDDQATRMVLDSTVVLVDPIENIDGHERHAQDNLRARGATGIPVTPGAMLHQGSWPGGRTSHYYFDLNRDWFIQSHPASRARAATFAAWAPHVAVDLHEMGSNSTYFFAPPMDPFNKNVPPSILRWWDVYAASNAAAFDQHGWAYFRREGYDEFYPGYGVSWPTLTGAVGMTYEEASSAGGAIRRTDGTVLTLREAVRHHYTAAWATLVTTARRRAERVRDFVEFRRTAVTDAADAPMRAVVLARDGQGRADSLVRLLARNDIAVGLLAPGAELSGATPYGHTRGAARLPEGGYVVDLAQPQGRLAKALLEPDAQLDSSFIAEELEARRTGRGDRFYDVTAWSLPLAYRVRAWTVGAVPAGAAPFDPGVDAGALGTAEWARRLGRPAPAAPARGQFGYAFAPGSEASLRLLGALLADGVRVWYAPRSFRIGAADFPQGAFVVRTAANDSTVHATVARQAMAAGAIVAPLATALVDAGTDLGSNSVVPVNAPRVALLGGSPVQGNSFGFAWFAFDQRLGYPVTTVDVDAV
ncbi:MAG TPA: M14 family zinc carboxypeptidase, partial [Gemmatimonadaceae bacterium]|nr:M14 family zinc carboxypeptidase [Gemmatimonadaceae bacterium]